MKKFFLSLFILTGLVLTTACSSDDDGGNGSGGADDELVVTIDGQTLTFNNVIVDVDTFTDDGETYTELDVTAIIGTDASRVIEFGVEVGDTGAGALYYFDYLADGLVYYDGFEGSFNSVITVNDGERLTMTFSGTLEAFDPDTSEIVTITLQNGSIDVEY